MTISDTPEQDPGFDLSRRARGEVAADIARRMVAFRQARTSDRAQDAAAAPAHGPSHAPSHRPSEAARAAHPTPPARSPKPQPAAPQAAGAEFAGAGLRASDPGHADVQTHPLFLHAHKTGQAPRSPRAAPRAPAQTCAPALAPAADALYSPAFTAVLGGAEDAAHGEGLHDLHVAAMAPAPARRWHRTALVAGIALLLAATGAVALWQGGGEDPAPASLAEADAAGLAPQAAQATEPPTPAAPATATLLSAAPVETAAGESLPAPRMAIEPAAGETPEGNSLSADRVTAGPAAREAPATRETVLARYGIDAAAPRPADAPLPPPSLAARDMPRTAPVAVAAPAQPAAADTSAPPVAAKLKPKAPAMAPAQAAAKPAAKPTARTTTATSGPLKPLTDMLAPLTRELTAASRALGGPGNGGATERTRAQGNGGNK